MHLKGSTKKVNELLGSILPMAETLIIKRDFDSLRKIVSHLSAGVQTQIVPYSALFCYEIIEYLNRHGNNIEVEQTGRYSIKDIRQKAKFFDLSINKLLQNVANVDEMQNEYFVNLMKYPQLGYWNVHTNLGIFFDKEKRIVGNTHYEYYLFQDEKSISCSQNESSDFTLKGEEIKAFGYDMGRIIGSISSGFSSVSDFLVSDVLADPIKLNSQDFNTNRCTTTGNEKYKVVKLFMLHVLSSIGFILFCLKKVIIRDTGLLLRLEYITYHYALIRLNGLLAYCQSHSSVIDDPNLVRMLEAIDYANANGLRKKEFRNCMMHFALIDKDGNSLLEETKVDLSKPLCGLVESQFDNSYYEYQAKIEEALSDLYYAIYGYLGFELLLATD